MSDDASQSRGIGVRSLGSMVTIDPESLPFGTPGNFAFRYIDIASVANGRLRIPDTEIEYRFAPSRARRVIRHDDVLMSTVRPNLKAFAHCDLPSGNYIASTGFAVLRAIDGNNSRYILYSILSDPVAKQIDSCVVGSNYPAINSSDVKRLQVPAFEPCEQCRIAEILTTLDETIEQTEALISKYQQIKAGLMHDLFTRGVTPGGRLRPTRDQAPHLYKESPIGWIPKEWEEVELKNEIGITHGFAFSGEFFSEFPPGEILLIPGNFHRDGGLYFTVENTKYFQGQVPSSTVLQNGEMVTVMTDLSPQTLILGRFAIIETCFPVLHNQRIGRITLKRKERWDWRYLCYALNNERLRRTIIAEATGTTVRHTSPGRILSNHIARPSLQEQQISIAVLQSAERTLADEQAHRLKLTLQKHGLMHDLLTGRVRVKIPETAAT